VHSQAADGGNGVQIYGVAVDILNKQLQRTDQGLSLSLGVGQGARNSSPQKPLCYEMLL